MIYLSIENVHKSYGEKVLLKDISLQINKGQKIALVAKNGSGKSTLMRIISGFESPEGENSKVYLNKEIKIGFLNQNPEYDQEMTVLEVVFDSDNEMLQTIKKYEEFLLFPPDSDKEFQKILSKMDDLKAWEIETKIMEVLSKLKLEILDRKIKHLSGGQLKRLALAKLIIEEPEFLILDEPTNHLDLDMVEWLENYLSQTGLTLFMVTHDRYFLERVCNHILELDEGKIFKYSGNYSQYLEKKALRREIEQTTFEKDQKLFKKELDWINRMPKARGTKDKSRIHAYDDLKDKLSLHKTQDDISIEIKSQRMGKKILELHQISKIFNEKKIIEPFSYKFSAGERIGIIGANGAGKSTFLNMISGIIPPDTGKIVQGDNTSIGYYTQDGIKLNEDKRVIEVIQDIAEYIPLEKGKKLSAAQLLEKFLFSRKHQQVYVSQLSGGEKRRLFLLTILIKNPNFLILDEPTNDLDILTLNVLEEFLGDFPGCVIIVSHDRYFMDKLVDHLFVFDGKGGIDDFNGNYSDYRSKPIDVPPTLPTESKKTQRVELSNEQQKEIKKLEKQIMQLEVEKADILAIFNENSLVESDILKYSQKLKEIEETLYAKEALWMNLVD
jgi:ABC transport system ATP-binding/permease protein